MSGFRNPQMGRAQFHGSVDKNNTNNNETQETHRRKQCQQIQADEPGGEKDNRQLIAVDGKWYDVTNFIQHHPGGDVILKFIGKDSTSVFHAFHSANVLKYRKPVRLAEKWETISDPVEQEFYQLGQDFEREGLYKANYRWYTLKFTVCLLSLILCLYLVSNHTATLSTLTAGCVLAFFWQQCGFFMHDFMHNHFGKGRHFDQWLGTFFANVCFGVGGLWWRDEHFVHHALTCNADKETGFADPQMTEEIWVQNEKLWFRMSSKLHALAIKIQHITFIPACVIFGRYGIIIDSLLKERRLRELIAIFVHWLWMIPLLSCLPSHQDRLIFYFTASTVEGILHIQLLISHYSKPFHELKDLLDDKSWYRMQVESNIDIINPWWMDWFHGGLNFHMIHHLYPRMPRHNYRQATKRIVELCHKTGLHYDSCTWSDAIVRTLTQLKLMSDHFSLDPR